MMRFGASLCIAIFLLFATGCAGTSTGSSSNGTNTTSSPPITTANLVSSAAATRFLDQSTFGPTPQLVAQVQQTGFNGFLQSQFAASGSTFPDPPPPPAGTNTPLAPTQQVFITNALTGNDQLRQRVAFALSQIWVVSGNTISPQGMAPYMRLLLQDAFGNYRTLMNDVTLSPAMGDYLDMVNNDKPAAGAHANENYARELMQLFTLGLFQLNEDGTLKLDSNNNPIPTYDQSAVEAFSLAFTGWTYPGTAVQKHNPVNYIGSMQPFESNHDTSAKAVLPVNGTPVVLPAGQSAANDLKGALDNIFVQPSLAPFVSKQLIQHLVTSNPSPAYVQRVALVFDSGRFNGSGATFGSGQRGDLQAVIAAILLDPEARRGDDPTTANAADGHLREPILFLVNVLRAFGATSDGAAPLTFLNGNNLNESPLAAPSVFNFFSPEYVIPKTNLAGPEFALDTMATTLVHTNFVNSFVFGSIGSGTTVDFTPYANLASNPDAPGQLLDSLNALLLHGTLSSSERSTILTAVNAVPAGSTQNLQRAKTAIYLILSSQRYAVEY